MSNKQAGQDPGWKRAGQDAGSSTFTWGWSYWVNPTSQKRDMGHPLPLQRAVNLKSPEAGRWKKWPLCRRRSYQKSVFRQFLSLCGFSDIVEGRRSLMVAPT